MHLLARAALERAQQVVERHGGSVEELPDGPMLAAFGSAVAHEDDAARALRAASELRARGVVSRAGLETGEIVISPGAPVSGPVVRAAVRLSERVEEGDILVSVGVERLVREVAALEPAAVGYRLLSLDADAPLRRLRLDAPLVGRADSLAALHEALQVAVGRSSARLVTVVGEPGIGKSRLAGEFVAQVSDVRILAGRCPAYGEGLTYRPLREILRDALGPEGPEGVLDVLAGEADAGDVAGRVLSVSRGDDDLSVDDVRWAAQRFLRRLALRQPLLVVVEDAHWAEPTFLDLLSHAVAASSDAPLLVLCLARPELLDERPDWPETRVCLERLSPAESAELLALLVPRLADDEGILAAASGNPLFLEQLAAFAAERRAENADVLIPPTLRSLLAARLDGLAPGEGAVLERAAVFGQDFWAGGVAELLPPENRASLRRHLEALAAKGLVEEGVAAGPFERGYRFRHVLIQEACYGTLPKRQRADFHELVARWLEGNANADRDQVVGYHLERAYAYRSELGQVDDETRELGRRAGERLDAAGERALDWGDAFAAANLLERARAALTDHAERLAVSVRLGEAYEAVGELKRAYALLEATREEAREAGDMRSEWLAAIKHAHVGRQVAPRAWGRVRIERIAAQAIEVFEHLGDDRCLTRAWLFAAANAFNDCRYDEAAGLYRRALEHGERSGEQREALVAHERLHAALYYGSAHVDVARAEAEAVLARAEGRPGLAARVFLSVAGLLAMSSEGDESRRLYVRAKSIMEEMGLRYTLASAPLWAEEVGLMFGDAGFAEREMRAGYEQLEAMGEDGTRSTMAMLLAEALYQLGRCEEAEAFVDAGLALTSTDDMATVVRGHAVKAKLIAGRGELQEAARLARAAAESAAETDDLVMRGQALMSVAEVYFLAGQEQAAKDALSEAAGVSYRKGNVMTARQARARLGELVAATAPRGEP